MFSIGTCMFRFKISIHLSSEMLTQKIRISIKRTGLIWVFFERKGNLKTHFSLEMWVQILAHIRNQKKWWYSVSHQQFCMVYPNRKKKKKIKIAGQCGWASEVTFGVQQAELGRQGLTAEELQAMPHCQQWARQCWEYQNLTSMEGSNPSCAREGS